MGSGGRGGGQGGAAGGVGGRGGGGAGEGGLVTPFCQSLQSFFHIEALLRSCFSVAELVPHVAFALVMCCTCRSAPVPTLQCSTSSKPGRLSHF